MGRRVVPDAPSDDDAYHVSLTPCRESSWRRILGRRTVEFGARIHKVIMPVEQQKMDATLRYLRHLRSVQEDHVNWMRNGKQPHLTVDLRSRVVEWMLIVGTNRSFGSETLFLAVNLFDAYLSRVSIKAYVVPIVPLSDATRNALQRPHSPPPPPRSGTRHSRWPPRAWSSP
jgi:hypothetical protein